MIHKIAEITGDLGHLDYSFLLKQQHSEQDKKKSGFIREPEKSTQVNCKEISQSLENPNYQTLFASHQSGTLLNPHVYKQ
jgi:hypothetical protein